MSRRRSGRRIRRQSGRLNERQSGRLRGRLLGAVGALALVAGASALLAGWCGGADEGEAVAPQRSKTVHGARSRGAQAAKGDQAHLTPAPAAPSAPALAATSVASTEQLVAAATLITISARTATSSAAPPAPPDASSAPALQAFSIEPRRVAALARWQRLARAALRGCALEREGTSAETSAATEVEISVELRAAPRPQDGHWILWPTLAGVTLEGLRALAARYEPFALQACVRQALDMPLRVPLEPGEPAPRITHALEHLTVEL